MKRRNFFKLAATYAGGLMLVPDFLHAMGAQTGIGGTGMKLIFIQLNGGNDGLNTFIPYDNPLYYDLRPNIGIPKADILGLFKGMGWHPSLKAFADIQQKGHLSVIQNVGYPNHSRSHFRSQEIWNTASASNEYLQKGWLGKFLDLHYLEHHPTGAINLDSIDNLSLRGDEPNFVTVSNLDQFGRAKTTEVASSKLSDNPQLDFVKKIAETASEGNEEIKKALNSSKLNVEFPNTKIGKNLKWIAELLNGNLDASILYTSHGGFDTHDNQLAVHKNKLKELDEAVGSLYKFLSESKMLETTSIVIFSEFGRRVKDNGKGTDHGAAAPMFVISKQIKNQIIGSNPNLSILDNGDLKFEHDFRAVYASLLKSHFQFDPVKIGIKTGELKGLFG